MCLIWNKDVCRYNWLKNSWRDHPVTNPMSSSNIGKKERERDSEEKQCREENKLQWHCKPAAPEPPEAGWVGESSVHRELALPAPFFWLLASRGNKINPHCSKLPCKAKKLREYMVVWVWIFSKTNVCKYLAPQANICEHLTSQANVCEHLTLQANVCEHLTPSPPPPPVLCGRVVSLQKVETCFRKWVTEVGLRLDRPSHSLCFLTVCDSEAAHTPSAMPSLPWQTVPSTDCEPR